MSEPQAAATSGDPNQPVIDEFRANGGVVGGAFEGVALVLLTTVGAKSGTPRTNPAVYLRDGHRILLFATNAGGSNNPGWFHNLVAHPEVSIEIGEDGHVRTHRARALPLEGAERTHFYEVQSQRDPTFREYQAKTSRTIPVVALDPID